ncbi:MAG: hypothetical protein U5K00_05190 [Melioribacteraceae bacterium]|nr:hypothetical protein [Melioribacteraceae bacterium]
MNDYYSDIEADFDGIEYLGKLGIKYSLLSNISVVIGLAYNNNSLSNQTLQYEDVGNYYRNFRKYDLLYKLTSSSSFSGFLKTQFDFLHIGEISLNLTYTNTTPDDQIVFEGFNQSRFNAWLQFRREVY